VTDHVAYSLLEIKGIDAEKRVITGLASTPQPDRDRDIVVSSGAKFKLPLPLLLDHNHHNVVGEVETAQVTSQGIKFSARIKNIQEPGPVKDLCDSAWVMVKQGLRRALSVGFRILDWEILHSGGKKIKEWDWFELSLVSVPANAGCTIQEVKSFVRDQKYAGTRIIKLTDAERAATRRKLYGDYSPEDCHR
jgi:HK97 family phage prohead protease